MPRPELVRPEAPTGPSPGHEELGIEELFRLHAGAVASLGLSVLQDPEEADDLVQDVFLRAWRALHRLDDREDARPWLMTIAIRVARTRLRRRKLTRLLFRTGDADLDQVATPGVLPEHRELIRRLYAALDQLPVELRIAWVLRFVQAETVESVARLCGWSLSTAKRRIQAAHSRVERKLNLATSEMWGEP